MVLRNLFIMQQLDLILKETQVKLPVLTKYH